MGVLPSNPDFKKLTEFQIGWLIQNIILDAKLEAKAFKKATSGSDGDNIEYDISEETDEETGMDDLINIMEQKRKTDNKE